MAISQINFSANINPNRIPRNNRNYEQKPKHLATKNAQYPQVNKPVQSQNVPLQQYQKPHINQPTQPQNMPTQQYNPNAICVPARQRAEFDLTQNIPPRSQLYIDADNFSKISSAPTSRVERDEELIAQRTKNEVRRKTLQETGTEKLYLTRSQKAILTLAAMTAAIALVLAGNEILVSNKSNDSSDDSLDGILASQQDDTKRKKPEELLEYDDNLVSTPSTKVFATNPQAEEKYTTTYEYEAQEDLYSQALTTSNTTTSNEPDEPTPFDVEQAPDYLEEESEVAEEEPEVTEEEPVYTQISEITTSSETTNSPDSILADPYGQDAETFFNSIQISLNENQTNSLNQFKEHWAKHATTYYTVQEQTGVPAQLIAAIHWREATGSFDRYLHNGALLGEATTAGSGGTVFFDKGQWVESAIHAMTNYGSNIIWNDFQSYLDFAEAYNGWGYDNRGLNSPYVWAGTTNQQSGKYTHSGFNPDYWDQQPGVYVMLKETMLS